ELPILNSAFGDLLIRAVGNTIIHSLWQGIILSLLGGLILIFGQNLTARVRYIFLTGSLIMFLTSIVITFVYQISAEDKVLQIIPGIIPVEQIDGVKAVEPHYSQKILSLGAVMVNYLNDYYSIIVLCWFLVICAKGIRMATGIYTIYQFKRTKVFPVNEYWVQIMAKLCKNLDVGRRVILVESGLAKVPMVIGHFKPVIMIPIGLINALSVEQVEAILAHELAHILRKDFLVNLLQSFMEIIFFFNPAVLWISSLIKEERENCCDDIAIAKTGNKVGYIQALVSCEEYKVAVPALSMAFKGNGGALINRVKRLLGTHSNSLNLIERFIITVCLMSTIIISVAFTVSPPSYYTNSSAPVSTISQTKPIKGERVRSKEVIAELMNRNLIPNKNKFTIRITNDGLYIDGDKQDIKLHRYILNKYVQNPFERLSYTQSVNIN
ncbi:MAG: M56 family metallopeptidase, partial [Flavobacterium sp.]